MVQVRFKLPCELGSHQAYSREGSLVIDWYEFGDSAPYESGNYLIFDGSGIVALVQELKLTSCLTANQLAEHVSRRFASYFEVRSFANARGIPYEHEVDFFP